MKKILGLSAFMMGLLFLASCATTNVNETLIVGQWKPVSYKVTGDQQATAQRTAEAETGVRIAPAGNNRPNPGEEPSAEQTQYKNLLGQYDPATVARMLDSYITSMDFRADKTATIILMRSSVSGTWKMNSTGTKVTVTDHARKEKVTIPITQIVNGTLESAQPVTGGEFVTIFKKQ
jgi:hypothetical protein